MLCKVFGMQADLKNVAGQQQIAYRVIYRYLLIFAK
jgi:hypothetical protein